MYLFVKKRFPQGSFFANVLFFTSKFKFGKLPNHYITEH